MSADQTTTEEADAYIARYDAGWIKAGPPDAMETIALVAEIKRLRATIVHIYGAATQDAPGARSADEANAVALTYICRCIEGAMPNVG